MAVAVLGPACSRPQAPAPENWPAIGVGEGAATAPAVRLLLTAPRVALPGGGCAPRDGGCEEAFSALHGRRVELEIGRDLRLGEAASALSALGRVTGRDEAVCLLARSPTRAPRCVQVRLWTAQDFDAWLAPQTPSANLRVILRADGIDVAGSGGKVPGPDRFGPTLPTVEGKLDVAGLGTIATKLKRRFPGDREVGLLASNSMRVEDVARVLAALGGPGGERFDRLFLLLP